MIQILLLKLIQEKHKHVLGPVTAVFSLRMGRKWNIEMQRKGWKKGWSFLYYMIFMVHC